MVDPIGRSSPPPADTTRSQDETSSRRPHVIVPHPQSPEWTLSGKGAGIQAGFKGGEGKGNGVKAHGELGIDTFGGKYGEIEGEFDINIPGAKAGGHLTGRGYRQDEARDLNRLEAEWSWQLGKQGASRGASQQVIWDNNPLTPESSGRKWDQIGGKIVERTGADNLESDGVSSGFQGLFFGWEDDHRYNPTGFRYERNEQVGALTFLERDVLGLVNYDPPSATVYTTSKSGIGIMRFGAYGSRMTKETLDSDWAHGPREAFDPATRDKAVASHAQLSLAPRSADVLTSLGIESREAFLDHIEQTIDRTRLPASVVVDRMHAAVYQAGTAIENDPNKSAVEAFAEQSPIDRPHLDHLVLDERLSPSAALDVVLARSEGDMRPVDEIISSRRLNGNSVATSFVDDAFTMDSIYSHISGGIPKFEAVAAAGEAHLAGDERSAGALVTDYRDNGVIDGSNIVSVSFGNETYAVLPGGGVQMVAQSDGTMAPVEAMHPETARGLMSMIDTARRQEHAGKVDIALDVIEEAGRQGVSPEERRSLYNQVRLGQEAYGDNRNADALIADSRDNGFIDGSNIPEATVGEQTYAVSTGGGVMYGRTTMTPTELTARANAHAAFGGSVEADAVAKARADAMAQAQRDGFASKDQLALGGPVGLAYDATGATRLADNEYHVAMQMQERRALDDMIAAATALDARVDVPIPVFKPHVTIPARKPDLPDIEASDGPDMRGDKIAYGRGVVDHGPLDRGPANTAYDNLDDWAADMRDMFNGKGSKVGEAKPNKAEIEQQEAEKAKAEKKAKAQKHEGGESRGQQGPSENEQREFGGSASDYAGSGGLL